MQDIEIDQFHIHFKYKPYPQQIEFMKIVLKSLKEEKIIALEAVTGFGKSLCLISTVNQFIQECKTIKQLVLQQNQLTKEQQYFFNTTKYFNSNRYINDHYPRLIFTSKTHSQLQQFKNVLEELGLQNITLASRNIYCLNQQAREFSNGQIKINSACKIIKKQNICKYFNSSSLEENVNQYLLESQLQQNSSMEFFIDYCKQHELCPYHFSKLVANQCDIVLSPYQYIFQAAHCVDIEDTIDFQMQQPQGKQIFTKNILVFDEAHNIPVAACEAFNVSLTYQNILECLNDIQYISQLYKNQLNGKNQNNILSNIQQDLGPQSNIIALAQTVQQLIYQFKQIILQNENQLTEQDSYYDFKLPKDFPLIKRQNVELCQKLETYINTSQLRQEKRHQCHLEILSQLFDVIELIQTEYEYRDCFKFIIQQTNQLDQSLMDHKETPKLYKQIQIKNKEIELKEKYQIQVVTLSPKYIMKKLTKQNQAPQSIILTSGTLSPMQDLEEEFSLQFDIKQSLPSIFTDQTLKSFIIGKNQNYLINGSYTTRNTKEYKQSVIQSIEQSVQYIKYGGILVFFTSYSILNEFYNLMSNNNKLKQIQINHEVQNSALFKEQLNRFYNNYMSQPTIFLAVYGGKLSEGIDFSNDMCRIVINVSIPFAPINSPYTQLKKEFFMNQKNGLQKYRQWYNTSAFRTVNQSCGRCVRHAKDFGIILLLDQRFQKEDYLSMLSKWISQNIQVQQLDKLQLNNWLIQKQEQYQKEILIEKQQTKQINEENKSKIQSAQYQTQIISNNSGIETQILPQQIQIQTQNQNQNTHIFKQQDKQYLYLQKLSLMDKVKKIAQLSKQLQGVMTKRQQIDFNNFVTNTKENWKNDQLLKAIKKCEQDCQQFFSKQNLKREQQEIALEMCIIKVILMN